MNPARIRAIYRRLQAANPDPKTELNYSTPFELLVAVMLSAHTTDRSVNAATKVLYPIANTAQAILALGEDGVKPYIKPVGMYNQKAKNLIELCRRIVELHGGEVPNDREALESLPGVGRKTANVILNIVFGHTTIAVDTHIFRVSNRTGIAPGKDPLAVEQELNEITPDEFKRNAHHWLLLHGRYVCIARLPACPKCIIRDLCEYEPKTPEKELPKSEAPVARNAVRAAKEAAKAAAKKTARVVSSAAGATDQRGRGKPAGKAAVQTARAKRAKAAARTRAR
jgi:endonuclease III